MPFCPLGPNPIRGRRARNGGTMERLRSVVDRFAPLDGVTGWIAGPAQWGATRFLALRGAPASVVYCR